MAITLTEARGRAAEWGAMLRTRDAMITECTGAGVTVSELSRLTGLSRKTIYDVLARAKRRQPAPETDEVLEHMRRRLAGDNSPAPPVVFRPPAAAIHPPGMPLPPLSWAPAFNSDQDET